MVKQKFKLLGTFEIGIPVTELAKDNGVGNKLLSIKWQYEADLLRIPADDDINGIMERNDSVGCFLAYLRHGLPWIQECWLDYGGNFFQTWKMVYKVFLIKKSACPKSLTRCVPWEAWTTLTEIILRKCYRVMDVKWVSSTWQTDIVYTAAKQKEDK